VVKEMRVASDAKVTIGDKTKRCAPASKARFAAAPISYTYQLLFFSD
jgi:hypothetical protein